MSDLTCTLETIVDQEQRRKFPALSVDRPGDDAMKEAIDVTCSRISAAFTSQRKIVARLRV